MKDDVEKIYGLFIRDKNDNAIIQQLRHGEVLIGRGYGNDLRINNPTVSTKHARIYTYLTVSYIEDMGSTNGTYVNGKRIDKHVLHPGDVIALGEYQMVLDKHQAEEQKPSLAGAGN